MRNLFDGFPEDPAQAVVTLSLLDDGFVLENRLSRSQHAAMWAYARLWWARPKDRATWRLWLHSCVPDLWLHLGSQLSDRGWHRVPTDVAHKVERLCTDADTARFLRGGDSWCR